MFQVGADSFQVEYLVVCVDDEEKKVRLSLRQSDILANLAKATDLLQDGGKDVK
jgi:glutamate--cysteine ligase catalytic subunit